MKHLILAASLATATTSAFVIPALAQPAPVQDVTRSQVQAQVAAMFAKADSNKDGAITAAELQAGREARQKARADELFARLDADRNGQVSRAEFDAGHAKMREARAERRGDGSGKDGPRVHRGGVHWGKGGFAGGPGGKGGEAWFARLDANKDGRVTLAEATAQRLQWFDKADANNDGKLTAEERRAARDVMRAEWKANKGWLP